MKAWNLRWDIKLRRFNFALGGLIFMSWSQRTLALGILGSVFLFTAQSQTAGAPALKKPSASYALSTRSRNLPCEIYRAANTPCVAAFSTVRTLYVSYSGPLYQVTRESDKTNRDVRVLPDGYADAGQQDSFCAKTACTITKIYDQSPKHNDLFVAPPGGAAKGKGPGGHDLPAVANALPIIAGGHKVYGIYIAAGMGYRNDKTSGIAVKGQPEGVYMVSSGTHVNSGCCFDFGNAETNNLDNRAGHMDAISLMCDRANPCKPHAGLDMEDGIYPLSPVPAKLAFVTAMGANDGQHKYAVYWGDSQKGSLTSTGLIPLPKGYSPMKQEGAIILGIGGDNSNASIGSFFEGAMTAGKPSDATMKDVQANIVTAGYAIPHS
ncbi:arabinofuranosidase catalytic domain-containing protein [Terracidiphilus sp.]|jgi:Alpha-L-arabinofuranosidase B, catalytic|uniref:arabinofuranosidase catalytic domain-containing protein n=1 Tax=Terracidiphilus sp. TaxID=1964191 RepID=UPI003C15ADE6